MEAVVTIIFGWVAAMVAADGPVAAAVTRQEVVLEVEVAGWAGPYGWFYPSAVGAGSQPRSERMFVHGGEVTRNLRRGQPPPAQSTRRG